MLRSLLAAGVAALAFSASANASTSINYGPISHSGMSSAGAASTGLTLPLQIGLIANQSGIQTSLKNASNPASSTYGTYSSLSHLASTYGASSSKYNAVMNVFKNQGLKPTLDVTHQRVGVSVSIGKAQKIFGVKWNLYRTSTAGQYLAMPVSTPKAPSGIAGNVDTIAGVRLNVSNGASSSAVDGGTPTRTGSLTPSCLNTEDPSVVAFGSAGLFPNQIQDAYGITPLQQAGLEGQGTSIAIVGEAPTPASDVNTFRNCFGLQGTALSIHNAGSIQPIIESSLDAMIVSTVAPKLSHFDLWVHPLNEADDDGDVLGFLKMLEAPLQATSSGSSLPNVISVSYGVCESTVSPFSASRTLVERELLAEATLGITVVVAAGDTGASACARGVPTSQLTSSEKEPQASWPSTSPWVLSVGGTNVTLDANNAIASAGTWNDTSYPSPYTSVAGGGGGQSTFESRPWWQPSQSFANSKYRMVPDVAAFADESPGYPIVCSSGVQGCPSGPQTITFVGGTSAAAPLVAGMIALWTQNAHNHGKPKPGFVPPMLYTIAQRNPNAFIDITTGTNALFGGSCCPARPGFALATGWGSPVGSQYVP